ncbi:hypothetical protein [Mucilaginibacter sp. UR6-11]|uniref:hypothetical protein n=1 Tax=Mucilaginibacter sp. UR6-11 TaxID=1435644 RepID=UPI001E3AA5AB|nr:hypothetical protein [Mucilaginibacter sp. UR6-11]MCC8425668.1 hypothetical protein [Mucilaginibacter sp. UR6-11]
MKFKYTYTLFTLIMVLYFVPANAQKSTKGKKTTTAKTVKKQPAKAPAKPAAKTATAKKLTDVRSLGDQAAKTNAADTTKGGGTGGTNPANGSSLSEEIVITSAYKPLLADAVKIRRNPDLEDKTPYKAPLSYAPMDKRLEQNSEIKQLSAMKIPVQQDTLPYNNLVRAGIGNLKTTFLEGFFGNGTDQALQAGVYVKHFAQSGTTYYKQNSNKDEIGVFGKNIGDVNTLSGHIDYSNTGSYFYGYDKANPPAKLDVAHQYFNTLGAEGEIAKNYKDVENDFTYALKLKGYVFGDRFKARENNLVLSGFLNQTINQFYAGLSVSLDLSTQKDSLYSYNNSIVRLNPYIKFQGENYKIDAGINIVDEFGFASRFSLFPAAKLEYQVIPKYVRLFVEAKGDVNKSSLRDFYSLNPFLGRNLSIKNSVDKLDLSAGLKGTLAPGLGFKADIYRNTVKDMPLLVSNFYFAGGQNRFAVIYDNGNSSVNGFNGELDYKVSGDVDLFGHIEFKDYHMASEAQAWNMPKFKLTAGTAININDKVKITGSLMFRGAAYDKPNAAAFTAAYGIAPPVGTSVISEVSQFADLSGGVEYKVNKQISIFGRVNNILNSTNQTWLYYPDYGFNIFGGASFSF